MLTLLLALALRAAAAPAPAPATPVVRHEEPPAVPVLRLDGAPDVLGLCQKLVPAERLHPAGDAIAQGAARAGQETGRQEAILARYEITAPAGKVAFAPYDGDEQEFTVVEPATLRLGDGAATLTATMDRALPVHIDAGLARRILEAQRAGRLSLKLVFDLPDDATCASDRRGRRVTLGVEPVEWSWLDGEALLAFGGVSADRPGVTATLGAKAVVEVGEPVAGPPEARTAVEARRAALEACYAEALHGDPALDGVLVVELGQRVAVAGDSTGSEELARCVEKALAPLAAAAQASVPVRFELRLPPADSPAER